MLRNLIDPLVVELRTREHIDQFYFIRYCLGGPHLRLRVRLVDLNVQWHAEQLIGSFIGSFLGTFPSLKPMAPEDILAINKSLLFSDPANLQEPSRAYPDNSWTIASCQFEIERYGGPERFPASLTFFCASSEFVLLEQQKQKHSADGWIRGRWICIASRLAVVLTQTDAEAVELIGYASLSAEQPFSKCLEQGNTAFERRSQEFKTEVLKSLRFPVDVDSAALLSAASRLTKHLTSLGEPRKRGAIVKSHLHMTANRLGLSNAEEVYLSQILYRAFLDIVRLHPDVGRELRVGYGG